MYLGIEIGGTKLQLGVGDGAGPRLAKLVRREVEPARGAQGILGHIREMAQSLMDEFPVSRVGIGFGGPVDAAAGRVVKSHHVPGWDNFPITDWCQRELRLPAVVGNDADLAGLAEAHYGAGRSYDPVFYVTVGTGIGGGLIIGGRVYVGSGHGAAELGHLRPGFAATGDDQILEACASGLGFAATARRRIAAAAKSNPEAAVLLKMCGGNLANLTARTVADAATAGNTLAHDAWNESINALGWGIAQVITLVAPAAVVVGGGVSLAGKALFYAPLRTAVERYVFPPFRGKYVLLPAQLGEEMVVHGAIALAMGT